MTHETITPDEERRILRQLVSELPSYYPKAESSNNYKLLEASAHEFAEQHEDIEATSRAKNPLNDPASDLTVPNGGVYTIEEDEQEYYDTVTINGELIVDGILFARSIDNNGTLTNNGTINENDEWAIERLFEFAKLAGVEPREGESFPKYKARVLAEFAIYTCEGTPEDVLETSAQILNVSSESIDYGEVSGGATVTLGLPAQGLNNTELTDSEVADVLERLIAASYSLDAIQVGTFTYITPEDYELNNIDATKGYDGLDTNGDPKDNGGTYAGVIN